MGISPLSDPVHTIRFSQIDNIYYSIETRHRAVITCLYEASLVLDNTLTLRSINFVYLVIFFYKESLFLCVLFTSILFTWIYTEFMLNFHSTLFEDAYIVMLQIGAL